MPVHSKMACNLKPALNSKLVLDAQMCVLCKTSNKDEYELGELKRAHNINAHHFCLLLSQTIKQSGEDHQGILGFLVSDIRTEMTLTKMKRCCYCGKYRATLGCRHADCKRSFHLPCGLANKTQHDFTNFTSLCHEHRKPSSVPDMMKATLETLICVICQDSIEEHEDIDSLLWAKCCRSDSVMHIQCMKKLAASSGYFTKCPSCNNKEIFVDLIKTYGVFVPDRDASWELEQNAYSDLYASHSKCTVGECVCPKGREFRGRGPWKIILCNLCGSFGAHKKCSNLNINIYTCPTCLNVKSLQNKEVNENIDSINILNQINEADQSVLTQAGVDILKRARDIRVEYFDRLSQLPESNTSYFITPEVPTENVAVTTCNSPIKTNLEQGRTYSLRSGGKHDEKIKEEVEPDEEQLEQGNKSPITTNLEVPIENVALPADYTTAQSNSEEDNVSVARSYCPFEEEHVKLEDPDWKETDLQQLTEKHVQEETTLLTALIPEVVAENRAPGSKKTVTKKNNTSPRSYTLRSDERVLRSSITNATSAKLGAKRPATLRPKNITPKRRRVNGIFNQGNKKRKIDKAQVTEKEHAVKQSRLAKNGRNTTPEVERSIKVPYVPDTNNQNVELENNLSNNNVNKDSCITKPIKDAKMPYKFARMKTTLKYVSRKLPAHKKPVLPGKNKTAAAKQTGLQGTDSSRTNSSSSENVQLPPNLPPFNLSTLVEDHNKASTSIGNVEVCNTVNNNIQVTGLAGNIRNENGTNFIRLQLPFTGEFEINDGSDQTRKVSFSCSIV